MDREGGVIFWVFLGAVLTLMVGAFFAGRMVADARWERASVEELAEINVAVADARAASAELGRELEQARAARNEILEALEHDVAATGDDGGVCLGPDGVRELEDTLRRLRGE